MSENKIGIRNLYKAFGKKKVLDGVDLDIKKGDLKSVVAELELFLEQFIGSCMFNGILFRKR